LLLAWTAVSLAACGRDPLVKSEVVYVDKPVWKPLDPALTRDIPEPAAPAFKCKDARGAATVCNRDSVNYTEAVRTWGRKLQQKIKEIRELQPE
jgi:hypothetical protein